MDSLSAKTKVAAYAISAILLPDGAFGAEDGPVLEEVIVTVNRDERPISDVPASVVAVDGAVIERLDVNNIRDLSQLAPGLHFTETGISTQVRIRGIGSDNSQGFEQSVGTYIDGISYSRAQMFRAPVFDVQGVEVVRGPQSTVFGKNSIAGALNVITARPTEGYEGSVSLQYAPDSEAHEANFVFSGPVSQKLSARFAARIAEDGGFIRNTMLDRDEPRREEQAYRATLRYDLSEDAHLWAKAERNDFFTKGRPEEITLDLPNDAGISYSDFLSSFGFPSFESERNYRKQTDRLDYSDNTLKNLTVGGYHDLGDVALSLTSGYVSFEYDEKCDCDHVSVQIIDLDLKEEFSQISHEIRLKSDTSSRVSWMVGAYYQEYDQVFEDAVVITEGSILTALASPQLTNTSGARWFRQESESRAVFGELTLNVDDALGITVGGRYSKEDKRGWKAADVYDLASGQISESPLLGWIYYNVFALETNQLGTAYNVPDPRSTSDDPLPNIEQVPMAYAGHSVAGGRGEEVFTPSVVAELDLSERYSAYVSYSEGFKSGGFDPRSNSVGTIAQPDFSAVEGFDDYPQPEEEATPLRNFEFDSENAQAWELGLKGNPTDSLELRIAAFHTVYEGLQVSQFDGASGFNVGNARETVVKGVEIDGRALVTKNLTIGYGLSLLDFEYTDFRNGNCHAGQSTDASVGTVDLNGDGDYELCDYTGQRGVYAPRYIANISLDYTKSLNSDWRLYSLTNVQMTGPQQVHVNLDPLGRVDSVTSLDAAIGLERGNWRIGLIGRNMLDEYVITYSANAPLSEGQVGSNTFYSFVSPPRSVALNVAYQF